MTGHRGLAEGYRSLAMGLGAALALLVGPAWSQTDGESLATAAAALGTGDQDQALQAADRLAGDPDAQPRELMMAADVYLRCGKADQAVPLYDRLIAARPELLPQLWQRGIALYLVGRYRAAAEQFVQHREVNPHDVENAAWHFLCVAKAESFERAKAMLLPAPHDARIPMAEVLTMLQTGQSDVVTDRLQQIPASDPRRDSAWFYGNFYLGLYADAAGDTERAKTFLRAAASDAPHHYMGDIARVYAGHLSGDK